MLGNLERQVGNHAVPLHQKDSSSALGIMMQRQRCTSMLADLLATDDDGGRHEMLDSEDYLLLQALTRTVAADGSDSSACGSRIPQRVRRSISLFNVKESSSVRLPTAVFAQAMHRPVQSIARSRRGHPNLSLLGMQGRATSFSSCSYDKSAALRTVTLPNNASVHTGPDRMYRYFESLSRRSRLALAKTSSLYYMGEPVNEKSGRVDAEVGIAAAASSPAVWAAVKSFGVAKYSALTEARAAVMTDAGEVRDGRTPATVQRPEGGSPPHQQEQQPSQQQEQQGRQQQPQRADGGSRDATVARAVLPVELAPEVPAEARVVDVSPLESSALVGCRGAVATATEKQPLDPSSGEYTALPTTVEVPWQVPAQVGTSDLNVKLNLPIEGPSGSVHRTGLLAARMSCSDALPSHQCTPAGQTCVNCSPGGLLASPRFTSPSTKRMQEQRGASVLGHSTGSSATTATSAAPFDARSLGFVNSEHEATFACGSRVDTSLPLGLSFQPAHTDGPSSQSSTLTLLQGIDSLTLATLTVINQGIVHREDSFAQHFPLQQPQPLVSLLPLQQSHRQQPLTFQTPACGLSSQSSWDAAHAQGLTSDAATKPSGTVQRTDSALRVPPLTEVSPAITPRNSPKGYATKKEQRLAPLMGTQSPLVDSSAPTSVSVCSVEGGAFTGMEVESAALLAAAWNEQHCGDDRMEGLLSLWPSPPQQSGSGVRGGQSSTSDVTPTAAARPAAVAMVPTMDAVAASNSKSGVLLVRVNNDDTLKGPLVVPRGLSTSVSLNTAKCTGLQWGKTTAPAAVTASTTQMPVCLDGTGLACNSLRSPSGKPSTVDASLAAVAASMRVTAVVAGKETRSSLDCICPVPVFRLQTASMSHLSQDRQQQLSLSPGTRETGLLDAGGCKLESVPVSMFESLSPLPSLSSPLTSPRAASSCVVDEQRSGCSLPVSRGGNLGGLVVAARGLKVFHGVLRGSAKLLRVSLATPMSTTPLGLKEALSTPALHATVPPEPRFKSITTPAVVPTSTLDPILLQVHQRTSVITTGRAVSGNGSGTADDCSKAQSNSMAALTAAAAATAVEMMSSECRNGEPARSELACRATSRASMVAGYLLDSRRRTTGDGLHGASSTRACALSSSHCMSLGDAIPSASTQVHGTRQRSNRSGTLRSQSTARRLTQLLHSFSGIAPLNTGGSSLPFATAASSLTATASVDGGVGSFVVPVRDSPTVCPPPINRAAMATVTKARSRKFGGRLSSAIGSTTTGRSSSVTVEAGGTAASVQQHVWHKVIVHCSEMAAEPAMPTGGGVQTRAPTRDDGTTAMDFARVGTNGEMLHAATSSRPGGGQASRLSTTATSGSGLGVRTPITGRVLTLTVTQIDVTEQAEARASLAKLLEQEHKVRTWPRCCAWTRVCDVVSSVPTTRKLEGKTWVGLSPTWHFGAAAYACTPSTTAALDVGVRLLSLLLFLCPCRSWRASFPGEGVSG